MTKGHRKPPAVGERGYERIAFDNYRTPEWVTELLLEHVHVRGPALEPACGDYDMAAVLTRRGIRVVASDIRGAQPVDFLASLGEMRTWHGAVVTNPPYHAAEAFVRRALDLTRAGCGQVAMLLPFDWDCALTTRGDLFKWPFAYKIPIGRRITWVGLEPKDGAKKVSPRGNHAWFVWDYAVQPTHQPTIIYP